MSAARDKTAQRTSARAADPDADIIPGLMAGNETAFGQLMDRHLPKIQALAYHMLGDVFMAEDAAQSVFLKTWQHAPNWTPGKARLLTWMRRVATNHCLDVLKKKRPLLIETLPEQASDRPEAFEDLIADERKSAVQTALSALPGRQRAAIILSYYQHVSQIEGADILGISVAAYESLLVRARKALKTTLILDERITQ
jgi:RNA polymerase sigma-70 factor (ECF subfamily)